MRGSNLKPHPHHLCNAARIVAVRLVDLRRQHSPHMSRLNTNHWQARLGETVGAVFGLTPSRYQSGESDRIGRISWCGDEMTRMMLYEAA
jgi:hypothetical protein